MSGANCKVDVVHCSIPAASRYRRGCVSVVTKALVAIVEGLFGMPDWNDIVEDDCMILRSICNKDIV